MLLLVSLRSLQLSRVTAALETFNVIDRTHKHLRRLGKNGFPHLRAPGFRTIRHLSTGYTGSTGRKDREEVELTAIEADELPGKDSSRVTYDPPTEYIRTAAVPRRIDVCVIDSVESLDDVRERVEAALLRFRRS